jgi:hypothetical protein
MTENEINENMWLASTVAHYNVRHIFPTAGMANKIAKEKITPAIEHSPNIRRYLTRR